MPKLKVICEVSNKHCHLTEETLKKEGLKLTKLKDLSQPGHWVSKEYYNDGIDNFRVILPPRETDQFELSLTDWIKKFGKDKEPNWKRGGEAGYVVTLRHLHLSPEQSREFGLKDGDEVSIEKGGIRSGRLDRVLVRVAPNFDFRVHLDTDEANALYIKNGEEAELIF